MGGPNSTCELAGKPRTRQRAFKAPPALDVPDIDEDAAERKRVLNVLAQRRYRARKRQSRKSVADTHKRQDKNDAEPVGIPAPGSCSTENQTAMGSDAGSGGYVDEEGGVGLDPGMDLTSWNPLNDDILPSLLEEQIPDLIPHNSADEHGTSPGSIFPAGNILWDIMEGPVSATTPSSGGGSSLSPSGTGFADSYLLPVHELTVLRALLRIAERLGCKEKMWSLDALSPFNKGLGTPAVNELPDAWRPTTSQILIPHHPIFDFLPWPGARDRIISVFSLPDEARPPNAVGPLALVNFAYDLEDSAEGVRIYGGDPYDGSCWEVGQVLFERWWFLFDREIVENSNRWRRLRGAPPLLLKGS